VSRVRGGLQSPPRVDVTTATTDRQPSGTPRDSRNASDSRTENAPLIEVDVVNLICVRVIIGQSRDINVN